ncbi:MAG: MFS transporter [Bifidobacteriaceae bacterium]|jgi:MHS family shikimate/dehydroshikimate transporter-like MFS transporter|nr:MFS transporter [Bifidobacteriaceae bacterium]
MANPQTTASATAGPISGGAARRRAAIGATVGTFIEYYDYYLYGLGAAAVFGPVFFPSENPVAASLSSFASFAVGFLFRPLGGVLFGHIGDRFGRKPALMSTVIGMGITTAAVGLIPPAAAIGTLAPVLLVIFRSLQGLFVGGEMGGATTLITENATPGRRGFYGSLLIVGAGAANVLSAGLMAWLKIADDNWFMTWGWRIPFLLSLVFLVVAVVIRRNLVETDEFKRAQEREQATGKKKVPLIEALRHPKNVILGVVIGLVQSITGYVILTFGLSYVVSKGVGAQVGFIGTMIVGALQIVAAPSWGSLSDRIGRKRLYIGAAAFLAVIIYPVLALYATNNPVLIVLGMVIGFVIPGVAMQATFQTMLAEMFDVQSRTTGVNLGYQLSNTVGGGFAPMICVALVAAAGGRTWPVGLYVGVIALVGVVGTVVASLRPDVAADAGAEAADNQPKGPGPGSDGAA